MRQIAGQGLHTGRPSTVSFFVEEGPLTIEQGAARAAIDELAVVGSERSTELGTRDGRVRVRTTEHLFAALAALDLRGGLRVRVDGPEVPLADGGAAAFFDALAALPVAVDRSARARRLRVARAGEVELGRSRYAFAPAADVRVEVEVDFGDPRIAPRARWDGRATTFRGSIAEARTFGFVHEIASLLERGLASHVAPESVVVFAPAEVLCNGRAFSADEPARHKLLDLVGDLFVHGGPPRGAILAVRPGHAATHAAVAEALARGVLEEERDAEDR